MRVTALTILSFCWGVAMRSRSSTRRRVREYDFESPFFCGIPKRFVRLHDVVHCEAMRHELAGLQLAGTHDLQQHRCRYRVN
jgi:hypothetical protein